MLNFFDFQSIEYTCPSLRHVAEALILNLLGQILRNRATWLCCPLGICTLHVYIYGCMLCERTCMFLRMHIMKHTACITLCAKPVQAVRVQVGQACAYHGAHYFQRVSSDAARAMARNYLQPRGRHEHKYVGPVWCIWQGLLLSHRCIWHPIHVFMDVQYLLMHPCVSVCCFCMLAGTGTADHALSSTPKKPCFCFEVSCCENRMQCI